MADDEVQDLLDKAKQGDHTAFDRLQQQLEPVLRSFIYRLLRTGNYTDDIIQDAFLALFSNLGRIESEAHLRPFLYRVVRNLAYGELRRQGRFDVVALDDFQEDDTLSAENPFSGPEADCDEKALWQVLTVEVQEALGRLPEPQRQTLILYGMERLSYEQVAEAMNVDVGTVRSRLFYGRKRLRRLLKPGTLRCLEDEKL